MLVKKKILLTHAAPVVGVVLDLEEQGAGPLAGQVEALSLLEQRDKQVPLEAMAEAVVGVEPEAELTVGVTGILGVRGQGKLPQAQPAAGLAAAGAGQAEVALQEPQRLATREPANPIVKLESLYWQNGISAARNSQPAFPEAGVLTKCHNQNS